jgi:UDP-N-acetylmuramate dehydrogenase
MILRQELDKWSRAHPETEMTFNVQLAELTTFKIGGPARVLISAYNEPQLEDILAMARRHKWPVFVLGGGSNVLFEDRGFRGIVLRLGPGFSRCFVAGTRIVAGAAVSTGALIRLAQENSLSGMEPLFGLPGTIGGAVRYNAGGRLGEVGELVERIRLYGLDGLIRDIYRRDLNFGYRNLNLGNNRGLILEVELGLCRASAEVIRQRTEKSRAFRARQPGGHSAGCIFKNPLIPPFGRCYRDDRSDKFYGNELMTAGQMIDLCGFKGRRIGGAQVSTKHANFIVNTGGARSSDVFGLIVEIQKEVLRRFGLQLETEISCPWVKDLTNG